jgi:recombination protein RecT
MSNKNSKAVATVKKDISAQVLGKIETFRKSGELRIPKDYSPENALKSAYLVLAETKNKDGKLALDHCSNESIAESLLKMVVWGLSPMKKQCDFIMYGSKLECSIEYTGNIVLAKRYGGLKDIRAHAIFKGDEFEYEIDPETGRTKVIKHKPTLESIGSKNVVGAYAVMEMVDGTFDTEVMSIQMIKDAWNQGAMKGGSPAHKNFPDQMAKKTVINRACKLLIRGSDDSVLFYGQSNKEEYIDVTAEDVSEEVRQEANKQSLEEEPKTTQEEPKNFEPEESEEERNQRLFDEAMAEEHAQQLKPGF